MPTVQVRFAPPLHERFIAECEKREVSPSEFIRRAVEAMMDHIDTPPSVPTNMGLAAERILSHAIPKRPASAGYGVRGYAADGSGEITEAQAFQNREAALVNKKKPK